MIGNDICSNYHKRMNNITATLRKIEQGNTQATNDLLPLVYQELRALAGKKMALEPVGQTLQATGLVHEAYIRLVGGASQSTWLDRNHFFSAAAEAMRRILVENARRKQRIKHGGEYHQIPMDENQIAEPNRSEDVLALHEALNQFAELHPEKAKLVEMHCFLGFRLNECADVLGISRATAYRHWIYARACLYELISQ